MATGPPAMGEGRSLLKDGGPLVQRDFGKFRDAENTLASVAPQAVVGIDIGSSGAMALLDGSGRLLEIADMPTLADGPKGRPSVNGPLLTALIRRWRPSRAYVEFVAARPGEGPTGAFSFGRSRGLIEGVLAGLNIPVSFVTPAVWKRAHNIPPGEGKDLARSRAIARWPDKAGLFARKADHNRAEAALIGLAGLSREARP